MGNSGVDPRWNASVKRKLPLWALMSLFISTSLPVSLGSSSSAQGHASSWNCNVANIAPKKTQLSNHNEEDEGISNDVTHAASNSRSRGANHGKPRTRNSSNRTSNANRPTHRQPPSSSWTRRSLLGSESEQSDDDRSSSSSSVFSEDEREQRIISALASATAKDHQDETMAHHKQPRQHRRTHSSYRNDVEAQRPQTSGPRKRRRKQTQKTMIHPLAQTDRTGSDAKNDVKNPVDSGPFSRNGDEGITRVENVSSSTIAKGRDHTSHQQTQSEDIALGPKDTSTLSSSRYYTPQAQTSQTKKDDSLRAGTERDSIPSRDPVPSNNSTQSRLSTLPRDIPSLAGSGASLSGTVGASSTQSAAASYPEKPIFGTRGTTSAPSSQFTNRWRSANSNTASASTTPAAMEQNRPNNNMLQSERRPTYTSTRTPRQSLTTLQRHRYNVAGTSPDIATPKSRTANNNGSQQYIPGPSKSQLPSAPPTAARNTPPTSSASSSSPSSTPWTRKFLTMHLKDALLPVPREYISDGFNLMKLAPLVDKAATDFLADLMTKSTFDNSNVPNGQYTNFAHGGYASGAGVVSPASTVPNMKKSAGSSYPFYKAALRLILDEGLSESPSISNPSPEVQHAAEVLYYLVHARYVVSPRGLDTVRRVMKRKGNSVEPIFGRCPRGCCKGMPLLPCGTSDEYENTLSGPNVATNNKNARRYCCSCGERFYFWESNVDGSAWGTSFCHLFLLTYGDEVFPQLAAVTKTRFRRSVIMENTQRNDPDYPDPTIFGFGVHPMARVQYPMLPRRKR